MDKESNNLLILKQNIKKIRRQHHLTLENLAEKLDVGYKTVQFWENENKNNWPDLKYLYRMCDLFGCDLDYLAGRIDEETHDLAYIHAETGLSTDAIKKLHSYRHGSIQVLMISKLIEHEDLDYLMNRIYQLIDGHSKEEVTRYHKALSELMKDETSRKYLKSTMAEDYFPVIDEVLKVEDERSIESIIRYQITDKVLSMIDDILQGKVGEPYK